MTTPPTKCVADPGADGLCRNCGRPTVTLNGKPAHKRGNWRLKGIAERRREVRRASRAKARQLRELDLEGDVCDCGVLIDVHPPLPKPKPLGGWVSRLEAQDGFIARSYRSVRGRSAG